MINLKKCPVCESSSIVKFNQVGLAPRVDHEIMPGVVVDARVLTHYFVCANCRIIFQNPRMSDKELNDFYQKGFYRKTLDLTDELRDGDELDRAKFDSEIIKKHIGNIKSHLDIGCGRGYLLDEVGADVKAGVESEVDYVKVSGANIYNDLSGVSRKKFDLVTIIHLLEHISDPLNYLKKITRFVNSNGHIVIEVPTWKSHGGPLRFAHLYHFEPDVLRLMCRQVGLSVIDTEFTPHLVLICKLAGNKIRGHGK